MGPYDKRVKEKGEKIIKNIQKEFPDLEIFFVGSVALEIDGLRDIDIYCVCNDIRRYEEKFVIWFGMPTKRREHFADWHFGEKNYNVDLTLTDKTDKRHQRNIEIYRILSRNKKLLLEYSDLKASLNDATEFEYNRKRLIFFNRILGL